jgi:MYXO-CTERM domain-containing protein
VSAPVADFAGGGSVDYRVHPIGEIQYDGTLHLIPAFYIDTIGPSWSIPIADIPIPFSFVQKDWEFDPVDIHVKLPDVALPTDPEGPAPVTEPVVFDLGSIEVGALGTQALSLGNTGEAELASVLSSDDPAVTVPPTLDLTPGATASFDALVKPTEPGQFESTIVVASNDPDEPEREIVLRYEATPAPSDDGDGDGDDGTYLDDVTPSGGGCACATSPGAGGVGGGAGALGLGFAAIAVLRRRARRQARAAR